MVRMYKKIALAAAGIVAVAMTSSALAAVSLPCGWYVEGNVGWSKATNKDYGTNAASTRNTGLGANIDGGYKFNPFLAAEVGATWYAETDVRNAAGTQVAKDNHYSFDLAAKGILPIPMNVPCGCGFELFGKLGLAESYSKVSGVVTGSGNYNGPTGNKNETGLYIGVGADYVFMPNVSANIQWARATGTSGKVGNLDLYSFGINYIFD